MLANFHYSVGEKGEWQFCFLLFSVRPLAFCASSSAPKYLLCRASKSIDILEVFSVVPLLIRINPQECGEE